jgi:hypothetical protein
MTIEDALIDYRLPVAERAKTLLDDAMRLHEKYNQKTGYVVDLGVAAAAYVIPEGEDPLQHLAEIETRLKLKDQLHASQRKTRAAFRRW